MKAKNVTETEMKIAMRSTNLQYGANIDFNTFEPIRNGVNFTLRVKSSKGAGHRIGMTGRKMAKACWHVHRDFMQNLFNLNPNASIVSCRASYHGQADFQAKFPETGSANIGSMMQPLSFANACECQE